MNFLECPPKYDNLWTLADYIGISIDILGNCFLCRMFAIDTGFAVVNIRLAGGISSNTSLPSATD